MKSSDLTLLFADDNEQMLNLYRKTCERAGFHVLTCENAAEVLVCIRQNKVDLLVTDLKMPHENSLELFPLLKKLHPELPIIVVSGHSGHFADYFAQHEHTVVCFFEKPVSMTVLLDKIHEILKVSEA